jgi:hypothetical protein
MDRIGMGPCFFEELLHEKAKVKQLFDITQVEDGASLAKVKKIRKWSSLRIWVA